MYIFQNIECIKWIVILNFYTKKVLIYYNIITVWYIQMIWLSVAGVWVNSSASPLFILVQNLPDMFSSWWHKIHINFSIVKQYLNLFKMNLKIEKTFNAISIKRWLFTWKI